MDTASFQSHYIPNTLDNQREMLGSLGIDSVEELFTDIPQEFRNPSPGPSAAHIRARAKTGGG